MKKSIIFLIVIIVIIFIALVGYYLFYPIIRASWPVACTMEAKLCPDGSSVGRVGPKCEFSDCPSDRLKYRNEEFGFEIELLKSWTGYSVEKNEWKGYGEGIANIVGSKKEIVELTGVLLVFKNPKTTSQQAYQNIPIMIFNHEIWELIMQEKVSVSAAPIPPEKIGENERYVFATPPRWYGFTDAIGWEEAVDIIKTFKAF